MAVIGQNLAFGMECWGANQSDSSIDISLGNRLGTGSGNGLGNGLGKWFWEIVF